MIDINQQNHDGWLHGAIVANVIGWTWVAASCWALWALRGQTLDSIGVSGVVCSGAVACVLTLQSYQAIWRPRVEWVGNLKQAMEGWRVKLLVIASVFLMLCQVVMILNATGGGGDVVKFADRVFNASRLASLASVMAFSAMYPYWRIGKGEVLRGVVMPD